MTVPALLCALGVPAGFLLIWRVPVCRPASLSYSAGKSVSIIIPARNEERNVPSLLQSIREATVLPVEVIVVDDDSSDNTAELALRMGARVLACDAKPAGWTGKSWACFQGAQHATGQLLLFLDADTFLLRGGLDRVIAFWHRERDPRLVVSLLPYHAVRQAYEQLSLVFNILMAAGAGGFGATNTPRLFGQSLLISKDIYLESGGHSAVRNVVLENLRWASKLRNLGCRIICLGGRETLHMRMFPDGLRQMSDSWAKAFTQGAADSGPLVVTFSILWISALWSTTLLLMMPHNYGRLSLAFIYLAFVAQFTWMARSLGRYRFHASLLYPLPLAYFCAVFARALARRALGRTTTWKGREV